MLTTTKKFILVTIIMFGVSVLTFIHLYYVRIIQREQKINLQFSSAILSEQLFNQLQDMNNAVEDLGAFLTSTLRIPSADSFNNFSRKVLSTTPRLRTLQFVNTNGIIKYTFPVEGNESVLGLNLKPLQDWLFLEEARQSRKTVMGPKPGILVQGQLGVIFRKPLYQNDIFFGWAQAVFNIQNLLPEKKNQSLFGYTMQIVDSNGGFILGSESIPETAIVTSIKINNMQWKLRVAPVKRRGNFNLIMLMSIWAGGLSVIATVLWNLCAFWRKEDDLNLAVRKRSTQLVESEERFRAIFEQAPLGVAQVSVDGRFLRVNNALCEMLGYTSEELLVRRIQDLTPEQEIHTYENHVSHKLTGKDEGFIPGWEKHYICKDGRLLWVITSISIVRDESGTPLYIISTVADINAQKEAEVALEQTTQELRALTVRLAQTEEETRKTIALEIHDDLGQRMTAIGLALDAALTRLSRKDSNIIEPLQEAREELDNITDSTRDIVDGLRPPILDDYGLSAAIRWYMDKFKRRTDLITTVNAPELSHRLSDDEEIGMFRILQEALSNTVRHSQASAISIELSEEGPIVCLKITDNGVGFDSTKLAEMPSTGHGLISMRERALTIGARLTFESRPEGGTVIEVKIEDIS